ncbi:hypothetical protein GYMLUDRAFT_35287 [Collybiopsis luxurians FD-317 M1]|nr:hypothetical protein GYMLUDRAFT_35287 [Collybiopsis luxurians FD-317 M1]
MNWLTRLARHFRNHTRHTSTDSESCSYDSFTQRNVVYRPLQCKWERLGPEASIPSVQSFPCGFPGRFNKQQYFVKFLPFANCLIHRPTGFGKTAFLDQLAAFCDIYSEENFDDVRSPVLDYHRKRHLLLQFDLANIIPKDEPFSAAGFRTKLQEHVDAAVHRWLTKYTDQLKWAQRGLNVYQLSTPNVCLYAPLGASHSTIITIDAYDTPFMSVSPEHVSQVKDAIHEILYYGVLVMLNGFGVHLASLECIFVTGVGLEGRDDLTPEHFLNIVDFSSGPDFAKSVGFIEKEIADLVEKWVAADKRESLLSEILKTCRHECFTEGGENVYSCREVLDMIAANISSR